MKKSKFKFCEAIVFEPGWFDLKGTVKIPKHPLEYGELVYFLGNIPNVPGHCIVSKYNGVVVPMVHPEDFRKATEEEL